MTTSITLRSPAKINLFLRVLGRRNDGYHELASLFQAIDLCDILHAEKASNDLLTCTHPDIPTDSSNLILKASALFRRKTGISAYARFHLEKHIPFEAGLGGGSSNAATALWALNELYGRPATVEQLAAWGSDIGSDVSFFLSEGTAYCTGRGEIIKPLAPLQPQNITLVKPRQGLSTPRVYRTLDTTALVRRHSEDYLLQFLTGRLDCFNDLEIPAFSLIPALGMLKCELEQMGFESVLMSGSGTSFFCIGKGVIPSDFPMFHTNAGFINRVCGSWY